MSKRIKLGLRGLDLQLKILTARNIVSRMKENPVFPEPGPIVRDVEETVVRLEERLTDVRNNRLLIQKKTTELCEAERELDKKLTMLAAYVESKAEGDLELIRSSGMEVRADSVPVGIPGKTVFKWVRESLNPGEIKLRWERVRGAKVYNVELTENIESGSTWRVYDSTTRITILVNGLKSGTKYWFRVQAIGSAGKGEFSEPITKYAP
jgi:hypothetical protein